MVSYSGPHKISINMINTITNRGQTLAIILQTTYKEKGINFSKLKEFSQQLAYMNRPSGYEIQPHVHNAVQREVQFSKEVLFQAGNAVILIDPDDSNSIADAMKSMLDESISKKTVINVLSKYY